MAHAASPRPPSGAAIANNLGAGGRSTLKQWSGARGTSKEWESMGRDSELWMRDGNCLVHLQGSGLVAKGPTFKIPFAALLASRCFPFVQRFLVTDGYHPQTADDIVHWNRLNPQRTVALHVPTPPGSDEGQALRHGLATRNLLAWAVRRSLVGESLSGALVALLYSLGEFRAAGEDNVAALMDYLDEEGYLALANQPDHALAMLHLAETFRLRHAYAGAFVHCVGMMERLESSTEYRSMSIVSRALVGQARAELDARLDRTASMLRGFLDEELSETHVGIPSGARAHLERFRSFLISFYSNKLGHYPPRQFDASRLRIMADDFAALYALLADDGYGDSAPGMAMMPSAAAGGICTMQLVRAFDAQHGFEALPHPLPLLPLLDKRTRQGRMQRRMSWFTPWGRDKADQRLIELAALVQASNWHEDTLDNHLVREYKRFEEVSAVRPTGRAGRHERASLVDARKVRWILIYAVHQTLRHAVRPPTGLLDDKDARYLMAARLDKLPPWREAFPQKRTGYGEDEDGGGGSDEPARRVTEIKPDIDYFALTHKTPPPPPRLALRGRQSSAPPPPVSLKTTALARRSNSLTRVLGRSPTARKLKKAAPLTSSVVTTAPTSSSSTTTTTTTPPARPTRSRSSSYHEIVVHGYGNGTNAVNLMRADPEAWVPRPDAASLGGGASRSGSTASHSDSSASTRSSGLATPATLTTSPARTLASSVTTPSPVLSPLADAPLADAPLADASLSGLHSPPTRAWSKPRRRRSQQEAASGTTTGGGGGGTTASHLVASNPLRRRPMSAAIGGYHYAKSLGLLVEQEGRSMLAGAVSVSRRHSVVGATPETGPRHRGSAGLAPAAIDEEELPRDSGDWTAMQAFFDGNKGEGEGEAVSWEQWADLGGLTEPR